jgi:predicted nuclease of predicted toxin-antitoxin system
VTPRFLVDAQLPPGLAKHLSALGYDADHVNRIGLGAAGDRAIWAYAVAKAAVLVTKDEDFVALARHGPPGAPVVWIRIGNCTNDALWRVLGSALPEILVALEAGERVIEVI